jgi:hypothetical protein
MGLSMSQFVWLDYSEHERRKMLDAIDLFREHDTVDELGVGSVRDTFGDLFFPGTSTIMTRARYFLIVPWIYQLLERQRVDSEKIADRARGALGGTEKGQYRPVPVNGRNARPGRTRIRGPTLAPVFHKIFLVEGPSRRIESR